MSTSSIKDINTLNSIFLCTLLYFSDIPWCKFQSNASCKEVESHELNGFLYFYYNL